MKLEDGSWIGTKEWAAMPQVEMPKIMSELFARPAMALETSCIIFASTFICSGVICAVLLRT
jgi:hypothetical protein